MEVDQHEMARRRYGFGRWDAPYWFIGPEEGQDASENDELGPRAEAWLRLGASELSDCRAFHELIPGSELFREDKPPLQATWKYLILLLMAYLGKLKGDSEGDVEVRRTYQRERWGRQSGGETCVIELSGFSANNSGVSRDRERFRAERIEIIRHRIRAYRPEFVVMYGKSDREHWDEIAGVTLKLDTPRRVGSTVFLFASSPQERGTTNDHWIELGRRLNAELRATC
jgi:hypothetical protein